MTTVSDNFTRANSSTLGSNWSTSGGGGTGEPNFSIISNQAGTGSSTFAQNYWSANTFGADQFCQATISSSLTSISISWYVCVRSAMNQLDRFGTGYTMGLDESVNGDQYVLEAYSDALGYGPITLAKSNVLWQPGDVVSVRVVGNHVVGNVNGVDLLTAGDDGIPNGVVGIDCSIGATNHPSHANFSGGDYWNYVFGYHIKIL